MSTKYKEYNTWYEKEKRVRDPLYVFYHSVKKSAKKRGIPFSLTVEDFVIPERCPILGAPLEFGSPKENSPSIDRKDNTKGYEKDNIVFVSWRANRIKSDATVDELRRIYEFYCTETR